MALFIVALLWTRIAGAHLHYCFDGAEPAAAVHVMDVGVHPQAPCEETGKSVNTDVDQDGSFGIKAAKAGLKLPALPARELAAPIQSTFVVALHVSEVPSARIAPSFLRPPLRGPPALSTPDA